MERVCESRVGTGIALRFVKDRTVDEDEVTWRRDELILSKRETFFYQVRMSRECTRPLTPKLAAVSREILDTRSPFRRLEHAQSV